MFIKTTNSGCTRDGEQFAHGLFLIVVQDPNGDTRHYADEKNNGQPSKYKVPQLRAIVRHVKMSQCGHFMMANVNLAGFNLVLSGSYGSDGLPLSFGQHFPKHLKPGTPVRFSDEQKKALWEQLVPIPDELQDAFWNGGGHNTCGKEAPSLRTWALRNLPALKKTIKRIANAKPAQQERVDEGQSETAVSGEPV